MASPPEVHELVDGTTGKLTSFTTAALDGVELATPRSVTFAGAGGDEVQMYVLDPPGYVPGRQWPLVHLLTEDPTALGATPGTGDGIPRSSRADGHVVAMVNFHGSTSWGQSFASSILGAWGDKPYEDIEARHRLAGLERVHRHRPFGGCGRFVRWLPGGVGHRKTDRYRCAIAHAAVTNLGGMYASDIVFHRATAYGAEY